MHISPFDFDSIPDIGENHSLWKLISSYLGRTFSVEQGQWEFSYISHASEPDICLKGGQCEIPLSVSSQAPLMYSELPSYETLKSPARELMWAVKYEGIINAFRSLLSVDLDAQPIKDLSIPLTQRVPVSWHYLSETLQGSGTFYADKAFIDQCENASTKLSERVVPQSIFQWRFPTTVSFDTQAIPLNIIQKMKKGDVLVIGQSSRLHITEILTGGFSACGVFDLESFEFQFNSIFSEAVMEKDILKKDAIVTSEQPSELEGDNSAAAAESLAKFSQVKVTLDVLLAQFDANIQEISNFVPGEVIPLGRYAQEREVSIRLKDKVLAKGQLVKLGDKLGLQLTEVK